MRDSEMYPKYTQLDHLCCLSYLHVTTIAHHDIIVPELSDSLSIILPNKQEIHLHYIIFKKVNVPALVISHMAP